MNLNHVVLIKLSHQDRHAIGAYNEINNDIFSKASHKKGKLMELSSSNILLPGETTDTTQTSSQDIIKRCFESCYWCLPASKNRKNVSAIHNLIYHNTNSIKKNIQLQKTLLRVIAVKSSRARSIKTDVRKERRYVNADVSMLVDNGKSISSEFRKNVFLTANISQSIQENDILNVVIEKDIKVPIFLVKGCVGTSQMGDVTPLVSLVLWRTLQHIDENSSLTKAGNIYEISDHILSIIKNNSGRNDFFYPNFMWNATVSNLKQSIKNLFPLYILHDDIIHQISPTVLSFIITSCPDILNNKKIIPILIRLLNIIRIGSSKKIEHYNFLFKGIKFRTVSTSAFPELFLSNLPNIINEMVCSRIFSKY